MVNRNRDKMVLQSFVLQSRVGVARNSVCRCRAESRKEARIFV